jgi:hypothetical protein
MTATWHAATSDPDPLSALGATRALVGLLSTWESQLVGEAIAAGATWERVGGTVGVSRQAAWERFHHDAAEFTRRVRTDLQALRDRHHHEMQEFKQNVKREAKTFRRFH